MVKSDGCLKFPENDEVRTDYDFSGVPFLCTLSSGKQRKWDEISLRKIIYIKITLSNLMDSVVMFSVLPRISIE